MIKNFTNIEDISAHLRSVNDIFYSDTLWDVFSAQGRESWDDLADAPSLIYCGIPIERADAKKIDRLYDH